MFQLRAQKIEGAPRHLSGQGCALDGVDLPEETGIRESLQDVGGMTPELKKRLRARVKRAASKINNTRRCAQERNWEVRKLNGWVPRSLSADLGKEKVMGNEIENEIQAKGLTAPRVTPATIEESIASEHYFTALEGVSGSGAVYETAAIPALGLLTFCILVMRNGFTVTGESACASPENFDRELGRKIARQNAVQKIWPLMGYALKTRIAANNIAPIEVEETHL